MRRNQLSFTIENFSKENGNQKVKGYIDANSMKEVLHELLKECNKLYYPEDNYLDFCADVIDFEGMRFGSTEINCFPVPK